MVTLSEAAWRYFNRRPTYPVLVAVRKGVVDEATFDSLYLDVKAVVEEAEDVSITEMLSTEGIVWRAVLLELSDSHYQPAQPPETESQASLRREKDGKKMIRHPISEAVRKYNIQYGDLQVRSGTYDVSLHSSLSGLGSGYFVGSRR